MNFLIKKNLSNRLFLLVINIIACFFIGFNVYAAEGNLSDNVGLAQLQQLQQQQEKAMPPEIRQRLDAVLQGQDQSSQNQANAETGQAGQVANQQYVTSNAQTGVQEDAFNEMVKSLLPLTPEQIIRLKQIYNQTKFATATSPTTPPRPTASSQIVNLDPGSTPPVIRLSAGFVSSLVFLDSSGAPWPIEAYDLGNPKAFNIEWDKQSNTLLVQATSFYTYGNLAVKLKELNTPVMLTLIPGQQAVDYRVDLRIQHIGPNAKPSQFGSQLPGVANPILLGVLDGVPPNGGKQLALQGAIGQGWMVGNKLLLRTRATVLSPGWISSMQSADGMHAYELPFTTTILISENGQARQIKIEGL